MTNEQRRVVVTLGFCGFVSAADNWFVSPALPAIAQALSVLPSAAAVILSAYLVPYGLLQPVCGAVGDRVGRVRLLRVIVMGLALATAGCALAPTLGALVAARIITGCFAAGIISVSQALVGDVVPARERSGAVGLLMGITFAGQGASPVWAVSSPTWLDGVRPLSVSACWGLSPGWVCSVCRGILSRG